MTNEVPKIKPLGAWLTVNRRCNFRCRWCYAQGAGFSANDEMPLEHAKNITLILIGAGVKQLLITGGEPTLWKHLIDFNVFCQEIGLETTLVTNGMRFGNDAFWLKYLEHPNTFVGISIKAGNPGELRNTAGSRQFATVTKGISRAMEHFQSGVGIVYNSHYTESLIEMTEYAMSCGAKTIKIDFCTPVFINGKPSAICVVKPNQLVAKIVRDYPRLEKITGGNIAFIMSIPFCLWPREFIEELKAKDKIESVCHLIKKEGIVVNCDGSLCMCNELFDFPIGKYGEDFHNSDSLLAFLNSKKILGYYKALSRYPANCCQECSWYMDCGGGCPLQWSIYQPEQLVHPVGGRR